MLQIDDRIKFYNLDDYLFNEVNKNFQINKYLTPEEFFSIIIWKSNRNKTKILNSLKEHNIKIKDLTKDIQSAESNEEKVNLLVSIEQIGIPIASAILTVMYPEEFTIMDYRVWDELKCESKVVGSQPNTVDKYLEYVKTCKHLADDVYGCSLRKIDQMFWGRSFSKDLEKLLEK